MSNSQQAQVRPTAQFELHFRSLFQHGRGYAFPCDASGEVDLDSLGTRARENYLYVRHVVGLEVAFPAVRPVAVG